MVLSDLRVILPALAACVLNLSPAFAQGGPPPVTVASPVVREVTEWDEYTGRFEPYQRIEIRARVSGYLMEVGFQDGQTVNKGDLLYVIDPAPIEATVSRARAAVSRAQAQAELGRVELDRGEKLLARKALARDEVDTRRANLAIAEADVVAAQAELRAAEVDLAFTRIRAPVSGQISATRVNVGNLVTGGDSGATLLTTLVAIDPIYFTFDVNEGEYLKYGRLNGLAGRPSPETPIAPVFVKLLDETGWARRGRIEFQDNAFDSATGTLRLRATFDNPDGLLLPGVFGRLRVAAGAPYEAVMIDPKAVLSDQSAKIVMTVNAENIVEPRPVQLGPVIDGLQVVREGLGTEDRIIVSGLLRARPGSPVTPQDAPMQAAQR